MKTEPHITLKQIKAIIGYNAQLRTERLTYFRKWNGANGIPNCSVSDLIFRICNIGILFLENLDKTPSIPHPARKYFVYQIFE